MANRRANGGLIGKSNKTSGGGNAVTTFNASGNFDVQENTTEVEVLVVAGGGGGGAQGGGGGAGGMQHKTGQPVSPGNTIAVTVGAGGVGGYFGAPVPASDVAPSSGANSVFSNPLSPITSTGGGRGGGRQSAGGHDAADGGSGGGGGSSGAAPGGTGAGDGTPGQGNDGGAGRGQDNVGGAGGGGSGAVGTDVPPGNGDGGNTTNQANFGQPGGPGSPSTITGVGKHYAAGGGGQGQTGNTTAYYSGGKGGYGGGGHGRTGAESPGIAESGVTNSGSGGGASGQPGNLASPVARSGAGGSGIVIVKEKDKAQGVFDMKSQFTAHTKGQWPTRGSGDEIGNSLIFDDGSSPRLGFTPSGAGSRTTWTWSGWVKRGELSATNFRLFVVGPTSSQDDNNWLGITLKNNYTLQFSSWSETIAKITNAVLRDPSAWYHIVCFLDTTNATASNRMGIYINGERITSFATSTDPSQNYVAGVGLTNEHTLGSDPGGGNYLDGYLSDINFIDGQVLHAGHFGEPDPDCPQTWRPKKYYGTYGGNGFHLEFKQSGVGSGSTSTVGADTSGNLNHLDSANVAATDQSTDTPTNNFATFNPLIVGTNYNPTFSEGNTKVAVNSTGKHGGYSSIGVANGKWYAEFKCVTAISSVVGIVNDPPEQCRTFGKPGEGANDVGYKSADGNKLIGDSGSTHGATYGDGDIIRVALDLTNNNVYLGKNGSWNDGSGNADEASINSAISITAATSTPTGFYFFGTGDNDGGSAGGWEANFGSPSFSISSGNADANGYGNFEYAVPSGYYALCSKNLAQYG